MSFDLYESKYDNGGKEKVKEWKKEMTVEEVKHGTTSKSHHDSNDGKGNLGAFDSDDYNDGKPVYKEKWVKK